MTINTGNLKKFAQSARRQLLGQVGARLEQVLRSDSVEIREKSKVVEELKKQIRESSREEVIDRVAYIWFNRFCALRFMDVNRYTRLGIVSPAEGFTQPEILQEAKQGVIDETFKVEKKLLLDLLNGRQPSSNPQQEAYRLLLVGACNAYHAQMPFLFPAIEDYTELLMPEDLLSENSVLQGVLDTLTPDACQDVEVIGWVYQYYVSERKDEVFAALKENQKIEARDIPAATQLFTPHWIVRYLVENSLGRLWMLNHPDSKLIEQMEYYIQPEQAETDFLKIDSPEEIKVCDPACGSGHMLTYAFDLLYAIYAEQGYDPIEIPSLILQKNLYGIEIDDRAGELAAFALVMKAREKDRRFFSRGTEPNICVLKNVIFKDAELKQYINAVGRDLFTEPLTETLRQFEQADNFGSLICPIMTNIGYVRGLLEGKNLGGELFLYGVHERVLKVLKQASFLAPRYHVVVTNPPYMGRKGMNEQLKDFTEEYYGASSSDTFAAFINRTTELVRTFGYSAMITMDSWMFSPAFEEFRIRVLQEQRIIALAHFGSRAFDSISGEVVSTAAFIIDNKAHSSTSIPLFINATSGRNEAEKASILKDKTFLFSSLKQECFLQIKGAPIAYWLKQSFIDDLIKLPTLGEFARPRSGLTTGDNERYLRYWHEVSKFNKSIRDINYPRDTFDKWVPLNGGGSFRKWYGNNTQVIFWENNGASIKSNLAATMANPEFQFKPGVTWSKITGTDLSVRKTGTGFVFSAVGLKAFPVEELINYICGYLNSALVKYLVPVFSSNITILSGDIAKYPIIEKHNSVIDKNVEKLCSMSKADWDSYETSWDFESLPLLKKDNFGHTIQDAYSDLSDQWQSMILETKKLEEENNSIIIESFDLQSELNIDIALQEVTLTCNPYYRYSGEKCAEELGALLLADTMREFISYAVGCMFGRYSLEKPGLILANAGETAEDYLKQVPEPSFPPDEDNSIPVLDGEWFEDDIAGRFKKFLKLTYGEEHYEENMAFIEDAIGKDIRSYFVRDFYNEHVKMYKKRPIYWMFSSPKGSFNVLMYMHRYRPDTISIILNNYLRQYRDKLNGHKAHQEAVGRNPGASQSEKTKALREIDWVNKILAELKEYEDEILYPLAMQQIHIDLDDGVKVNYAKFGKALREIKGL